MKVSMKEDSVLVQLDYHSCSSYWKYISRYWKCSVLQGFLVNSNLLKQNSNMEVNLSKWKVFLFNWQSIWFIKLRVIHRLDDTNFCVSWVPHLSCTPQTQKMKFLIKYFFSKCNQIHFLLRICSHLRKEYLIVTSIFCGVVIFLHKIFTLPH